MERICSCELNQHIVDSLVEEELGLRKMKANVNLIFQYARAIKAMTLYPLPIKSKEDAMLINGVGGYLAAKIQKIIQNGKNTTKPISSFSEEEESEEKDEDDNLLLEIKPRKRRKLNKKERIVESEFVLPIDDEAMSLLDDYSDEENNDNFELILLVDNREMRSKEDRTYIHTHLLNRKINCRICQLPLGDYQWIIKDKRSGIELLSDYIIERKTSYDLAHSIFDGRYHEQKYRLKNSGLHHIIYLIEGCLISQDRIPKETLESSIIHTEISDGFMIERTVSIDGTVEFLSRIHNIIENELKNNKMEDLYSNILSNPPTLFNNYCEYIKSMKDLKLVEYFGQQLSQIKGMGVLQVKNIINKYPTPYLLRNEYKNINGDSENGKLLLYNNSNHLISKKNSESVYNVFNSD